MLAHWKKSHGKTRQDVKKQRHYFTNKGPSGESYDFSSSHVWMWELDYKESWVMKNWCFWTVVLEKTESPLDCKEIQPVHPKGNQSWIFIGRTDAVPETPVLWPPDAKNQLIGKDPDAADDWRQEEKGRTEDEIVGWHHQHNAHECESALGVGDGQGGLAYCGPWGRKELEVTEWLNWTELFHWYFFWALNFTVHILLKTGLENFERYFTSMWDEYNCAVAWAFFGISFLWDWNENWPFPVLWPLQSFPNLLAYWVQHFHSIIFQDLK